MIYNTNWDALINNNDISVSLCNWVQQYLHIMDESIPKGTLPKRQNLPWLSKNLLRAMRKHNYLYRQAKRTGLPKHVRQYRTGRNKTVTMLSLMSWTLLTRINSGKQWNTYERSRIQSQSVSQWLHCTQWQWEGKHTQYFLFSVFQYKAAPLTPSDSHSLTASDECPESILCTEEEILHLLQNIDVSKSSGP